ncbi:hypothetical protein [Antrihabitans cavernicola]|uniref:Uncharacterized protein n=1 Tax=Antrihabitans cavernicola TaxID=2495913 RepID=A0A5A7SDJ8_9NOCA|nr:hypothetical protein [Spelaeibacter cavernicola]KAA0022663.1 hypothetical protein FOY51_13335 [Spelaeibacter cavernicola]
MSARTKFAARTMVIGAVAAASAIAASATAAAATPVPLSPIYTIGHGAPSGPGICAGSIDATAYADTPSEYGTNSVSLITHFFSLTPICLIEGTLTWHNLDTGATGTKGWALSGHDGPGAPTAVYFTPGAGKVDIQITTTTPNIPSRGQFTAT